MTSPTLAPDDVHVVVLGAGYAGMIATNRLLGSFTPLERARVTVTVVNERAVFVERIRLHELAAGTRASVSRPLAEVLHPDATIIEGRADLIDPVNRVLGVRGPAGAVTVPYDYLVYAVGSVAATDLPGARTHAYPLGDFDTARAAAAAIAGAGSGATFAVVGGGFTGVEAASELAEQHPGAQVTLFCSGRLVPGMRPAARTSIDKALRRLGVDVREESDVAGVEAGMLRLADGTVHAFDVCLVATSFTAPDLAAVSGLDVDEGGRLRVDANLRSLSAPSVIGAGDAVVAPIEVAGHLRMGCAVALPLGGLAAETVLATIRDTKAPVVSVGFLVQCLSLGRRRGYVQLVRADDSPRSLHLGGRLAATVKEKICTMVLETPIKESVEPGAYAWPRGPKRSAHVAASDPPPDAPAVARGRRPRGGLRSENILGESRGGRS